MPRFFQANLGAKDILPLKKYTIGTVLSFHGAADKIWKDQIS